MKITLKLFSILFVFLVSTASIALSVFDSKEVEASAKARWDSIIKHEFGETYQYETPTYKAVFTKDLYVNQFSDSIDWRLTEIESIKYDPATHVATVVVVVETKPRNSKELDASLKTVSIKIHEKWLHDKGRWWHSSSE